MFQVSIDFSRGSDMFLSKGDVKEKADRLSIVLRRAYGRLLGKI